MLSQDYLFMVLLMVSLLFMIHWAGGHHLRH
jgi:hypothetical protein